MSLLVLHGPMFSGKSTELQRHLTRARAAGLTVLPVTHRLDTRPFGTHDGRPALEGTVYVDDLASLWRRKSDDADDDKHDEDTAARYAQAQVVGVDEAQFFSHLLRDVRVMVEQHGKTVVVAGLDGNFLRQPFGEVLDLIPWADDVVRLTAVCKACVAEQQQSQPTITTTTTTTTRLPPACFTRRKHVEADPETVVVGAGDLYEAVCRRHYRVGTQTTE